MNIIEMEYIDVHNIFSEVTRNNVRLNPKTVFGYKGIEGAVSAVTLLFKAFVTEIALGHGDRLNVELLADNRIRISGNNRGVYIVSPLSVRGRLFQMRLPYFDEPEYQINKLFKGERPGFLFNNSNDTDVPENFEDFYKWTAESFFLLNSVSDFFDVISRREGMVYHLTIENGKILDYEKAVTKEESGTAVEFKLSEEVFNDINITAEMLVPMIKYAARNYSFAKFSLNGKRIAVNING